jgi:uncharacterized protein (TIGR00288 family)
MLTENVTQDVAVFIDFENVYVSVRDKLDESPNFESIMDRCNDLGRVIIARAYADWYRFPRITSALYANGIEPIYVPTYYYDKEQGRTGRAIKNSVDMNLCIDAMKTLFQNNNVRRFVLATGDRDFIPLVNSIRQQGKEVIVIGIGGAASTHLAQSADEFIFYEQLVGKTTTQTAAGRRARVERSSSTPATTTSTATAASNAKTPEPTPEPDIYDTLVEAVHLVRERGYLSTLGSLKLVMKELMGGEFKESRYKDMNGRSFSKFKDFVIDAEKRGKVQIYTSGTVSEVFLPGEDASKLSQFAELREEAAAASSATSNTNGREVQAQSPETTSSSSSSSSSSRTRRRRRPRNTSRPDTTKTETTRPESTDKAAPATAPVPTEAPEVPTAEATAPTSAPEPPQTESPQTEPQQTEPQQTEPPQDDSQVLELWREQVMEQGDTTQQYDRQTIESWREESDQQTSAPDEDMLQAFESERKESDTESTLPVIDEDPSDMFNVGEALTLAHIIDNTLSQFIAHEAQSAEPADEHTTPQPAEADATVGPPAADGAGVADDTAQAPPADATPAAPEAASDQTSDDDSQDATDDETDEGDITFSDEEWQAFQTMMEQFTKPASFAQIFDALRALRKEKVLTRTNEQLRTFVKHAINNGLLERSGRGKRVYYTLKQPVEAEEEAVPA